MVRAALSVGLALLAALPSPAAGPPAQARGLDLLVGVLRSSEDLALQRDVLRGMVEALQGRRHVTAPAGWSALYTWLSASKDAEVREKALVLAVLFGDPRALAELRRRAADPRAPRAERRAALQTLVEKRAEGVLPLLQRLLDDPALRGPALRALAGYDDPHTPRLILARYPALSAAEKADAVATLASRPAFALALLDAVGRARVPRADLSAFTARQLLALGDRRVEGRLREVWGAIRPPAADKVKLLARYKALVKPAALKGADRRHGRLVFARTCATCHILFGEGSKIGPDLTGAQRTNPEYVLGKVLDPNAVVARDYQVTRVVTSSGRVITGLVKEETARTLLLQTPNEVVRVAKSDIEQRSRQAVSLMPEGLLDPLRAAEVRDLLAYLAGAGQVPLPAGREETPRRGR
jgi:putative heme-binding domain-containing protein